MIPPGVVLFCCFTTGAPSHLLTCPHPVSRSASTTNGREPDRNTECCVRTVFAAFTHKISDLSFFLPFFLFFFVL